MVYYGEGQAAARLQSSCKTILTEFFAYNAAAVAAVDDADGDADVALSLLYQDFPTHFTWDKANKKWRPKQRRAAQPQVGILATARGSTSACSSVTCPGPSFSGPCAHSRTAP